MSLYEQYFRRRCAELLGPNEQIKCCGYFREYMAQLGLLADMLNAARLKGYFIAITNKRFIVIETRAPATTSPLMENKDSYSVPIEDVKVNEVMADKIVLSFKGKDRIFLEMFSSNKYISEQIQLVEQLHSVSKSSEALEIIFRRSKFKHAKDKFVLYYILAIPLFIVAVILLLEAQPG